MANTNSTNTVHELSTAAGCQSLYKAKGRNLKREDFPMSPEGWSMWCGHRIRKHQAEVTTATESLAYWTKVQAGEHLKDVVTAIETIETLTRKLEAAKAEKAALEAKK